MADNDKNLEAAAKSVEEARKANVKSREEQLASERKASDEDTKAYYERVSGSKPTPTQEENDRAKLGFDSLEELDNKEPDGSEEVSRDLSAGRAEAYKTRSLESKK